MSLSGIFGGLSDFVGGLTPIASGIGNIMNILGGNKDYKKLLAAAQQPTPAEQRAGSLYESLLQPNNSLVKQMTDDETRQGMSAFLSQIKAMQMADARAGARGKRGAFFNPERADETVNYLVSRGLPGLQQQARTNARNDIYSTATAIGGQSGLQQQRQNMVLNAMGNNAAYQSSGGGLGPSITSGGQGIQDMLKAIQGMF